MSPAQKPLSQIVIVESPADAKLTLGLRRAEELNTLLTPGSDECFLSFAARVQKRVRSLRQTSRITGIFYVMDVKQGAAERTRGRALRGLIRVLEPGAAFTLIAGRLSQADVFSWLDGLRLFAKTGVQLNALF